MDQNTNLFWQECNGCGREFQLEYHKDGSYAYIGATCDCEESFSPKQGEPSISQWLEEIQHG